MANGKGDVRGNMIDGMKFLDIPHVPWNDSLVTFDGRLS